MRFHKIQQCFAPAKFYLALKLLAQNLLLFYSIASTQLSFIGGKNLGDNQHGINPQSLGWRQKGFRKSSSNSQGILPHFPCCNYAYDFYVFIILHVIHVCIPSQQKQKTDKDLCFHCRVFSLSLYFSKSSLLKG